MPKLDFKGKSVIYSHHLGVPFRQLKIDKSKSLSKNPSLDDNLIIHGDNLHALKSLLPRYAGKVKCIYIDPPYNTGNEGWKYNDKVNSPMLAEWLKKAVDTEDLERHDKWLCMMWPRLQLLKELLAEDGVILVSIDDNESHRLKILMDDIFGTENYLLTYYVKVRYPEKTLTEKNEYQKVVEQVFVYKKHNFSPIREKKRYSLDKFKWEIIEKSKGKKIKIKNKNVMLFTKDEYEIRKVPPSKKNLKETWATGTVARNNASGKFFAESLKSRKKIDGLSCLYKVEGIGEDGLGYRYFTGPKKQSATEGKFYSGVPIKKKKDIETDGSAFKLQSISNFYDFSDAFGNCRLEGNISFTSGKKPIEFLKKILSHCVRSDGIILDSFAGSGSTAHAVLDLNKEDGGNRKFILVECEDYADKITAERVRRVIKGVSKSKDEKIKKGLGGSFTYCKVGEEISEESLLKCKSLPSYEALAKYVFYTATGKTLDQCKENKDYFVSKAHGNTAFFMIYEPSKKFLRSKESALNLERKEQIQKIMKQKQCSKAIVFAPTCFIPRKELQRDNLTFCQLPFAIHKIMSS